MLCSALIYLNTGSKLKEYVYHFHEPILSANKTSNGKFANYDTPSYLFVFVL